MIFVLIIIFFAILLYIYAINDLNRREFATQRTKANWLTLIFFFPVFGAIIYLLNRKDKKRIR